MLKSAFDRVKRKEHILKSDLRKGMLPSIKGIAVLV